MSAVIILQTFWVVKFKRIFLNLRCSGELERKVIEMEEIYYGNQFKGKKLFDIEGFYS